MIRTLRGNVIERGTNTAIVETSGVGYLVYCTPDALQSVEVNDETFLWIYQTINDDQINLYGFAQSDDVALFEQLLTVSGIGPKRALAIMATCSSADLRTAISSGETKRVRDVTGVGKKVADKIILELQNKVEEAREAVKHVSSDTTDASERIKEALRYM